MTTVLLRNLQAWAGSTPPHGTSGVSLEVAALPGLVGHMLAGTCRWCLVCVEPANLGLLFTGSLKEFLEHFMPPWTTSNNKPRTPGAAARLPVAML